MALQLASRNEVVAVNGMPCRYDDRDLDPGVFAALCVLHRRGHLDQQLRLSLSGTALLYQYNLGHPSQAVAHEPVGGDGASVVRTEEP
nr:hypothetical protein [Kibdelosporangium sp. MJ126-NF4]CTQ89072.1 hypothetical protein [Kibdelosporangium sp. MJ126-NF4]